MWGVRGSGSSASPVMEGSNEEGENTETIGGGGLHRMKIGGARNKSYRQNEGKRRNAMPSAESC